MDAKYVQCAAKCCGNKLLDRPDLTFFPFPGGDYLAKIWSHNSNLPNFSGSTLCSEHFEDKYLDTRLGRKVFKANIKPIPTIFGKEATPGRMDDSLLAPDHFKKCDAADDARFDYCRLCANLISVKTLLPIFGASNYSELLELCLPGKFLETDDLSHKICISCVSQLENCCIVLKSFIEADKKLRNISHQSATISNSSDEIIDILKLPEREVIQYQCIMCPSIFNRKEEMVIHAFHSHPSSRGNKIISNLIKKKVAGKEGNDSNLITQNPTKRFQCIICLDLLNTKEEVIAHTKTKHNILSCDKILTKIINLNQPKPKLELVFMCISCSTIFGSKEDAIKHSLLQHGQNKIVSKTVVIKRYDSDTKKSGPKFQNILNPIPIINHNVYLPNKRAEPYTTFQIQYQCKDCCTLFNSYKNVLDHAELVHPTLKESGLVASLVKVNNKENQIICVNDETIIEIDSDRRKMIKENRYKCLKCFKLFANKKMLLQHLSSEHQTDDSNVKLHKVKGKFNSLEIYECLICCSHHTAKSGLIQHTHTFHPSISKDKFLCRFITRKNIKFKECLRCNACIKNYNQYQKHMRNHVTFNCDECGEIFNQLNHLKAHLGTHIPLKTVPEICKCVTCENIFTNKEELHSHEQTHKILKDVSCSKCNKAFTSEYELKKHERNTHVTCLCDICGKTYEIKYIKNHIKIHNTNKPYKCKLCARAFKTCGALSKHKKEHFPKQIRYVLCQICGKKCLYQSIKVHMQLHSDEMPWACEICGESFRRKDYLKNHKKTHMQNTEIYNCKICNINLFCKRSYQNHLTSIHNIPKLFTKSDKCYTCDICKKVYKNKVYMEDHLRMHAGQKNYSCNVCGKAFGTRINLLQHKKIHLDYDELPYLCDICQRKFRRMENLRNHRRIHTGEKPFPCPVCQRPFRVRGEMVKHMRIHKRNDERNKTSLVVNSESDNTCDNLLSVHDSNSSEESVNSNMPSLNI